jgi:hypothetical protein
MSRARILADYVSSGDELAAVATTANAALPASTAASTYAPIADPIFTGTVQGVTKAHVGLGSVTDESKATMFTSPTFTGNAVLGTPASGDLKNIAPLVGYKVADYGGGSFAANVGGTAHTIDYTPVVTNSTIIVKASCCYYGNDAGAQAKVGTIERSGSDLWPYSEWIVYLSGTNSKYMTRGVVCGKSTAHTASTSYTWRLAVYASGNAFYLYGPGAIIEVFEYNPQS